MNLIFRSLSSPLSRVVAAAAALACSALPSAAAIVFDDGGTHTVADASLQAEHLIVRNGSTLRIVDGAAILRVTVYDTSRLEMTGGVLDGTFSRIDGWGNASIDLSGGAFGPTNPDFIAGNVQVQESARLTISGGVFGGAGERSGQIVGKDDAVVTISGGSFGGIGLLSGFIEMIDRNELTVTGGTFGAAGQNSGKFNVRLNSTVTVSGGTFDGAGQGAGRLTVSGTGLLNKAAFLNGARIESLTTGVVRIPGNSFNLPFGPVADLQGSLTGILADGSAFEADYYRGYDPDLENGIIELVEVCPEATGQAEFFGLGQLPNGGSRTGAADVSSDGSAVVGWALTEDGWEAFLWDASGLRALQDLPGGAVSSYAVGVSGDGTVIVGEGADEVTYRQVVWDSPQSTPRSLPVDPAWSWATVRAISGDGRIAVGWGGRHGVVWNLDDGSIRSLADLPVSFTGSNATDVSADGSIVVGTGSSRDGRRTIRDGFVWNTQTNAVQTLPSLGGDSYPGAVSEDGTVVVGRAFSSLGREAGYWDLESGTVIGLGDLRGGNSSSANGVSADGSVVVGSANSESGSQAFLWEAGEEMRSLTDLLENDHGLDLAGWTLWAAWAVSDDGLTIVGEGLNPQGQSEAWLARLPAPNSAPVVTCPSPPASFQCDAAGTPDNGPGARLVLNATVSDPDGQNLTVTWEVDGVEVQRTANAPSGTIVELDHVFPMGESAVSVTVADCLVSSTCATMISVLDTTAPVVICQPGVTVPNDPGTCEATLVPLPEPVVSDNCEVVSLTHNAPASFPLGETEVTWTVQDASGNTATCTQTVTVLDTEPPVLVCPPDVVVGHDLDSEFASGVDLGTPIEASDNCAVVSLTHNAPASFPLGETEVFWIAKDAAGNEFLCTQRVTVTNQAPTVQCPEPVQADCSGATPGATVELSAALDDADHSLLTVTWTDGSGQVLQTGDVVRGTSAAYAGHFPMGTTEVTVTVSDGIDSTSCSTVVTVLDLTAPVLFCLPNVMVGTDPGACVATNVDLGTPTVTDNCGLIVPVHDAPAIFPLGDTVVTWTATDGAGNTATCTQTVTVIDDEAPVMSCPPALSVPHDPDTCVAANLVLPIPVATDNCAVVSLTHNAPSEFAQGDTIVTWTATDAAGNTTTCEQVVTVTNQAPSANAGEDLALNCTSPAGAEVTLDGTASSDPEGDTLVYQWSAEGIGFDDDTSATPTATFPIGSTRVTLTVTDACGAVSSANVMVVVFDTVAPVIQITDASHDMLWPPNHDLVPVTLRIIVADDCTAPEDLVVTCTATSDEPDDSTGDGAFTGDVNGQDGYTAPVPVTMTYDAASGSWEATVMLRSERKGKGDGRKYAVRCSASDSANTTTATICVVVPHNKGKRGR